MGELERRRATKLQALGEWTKRKIIYFLTIRTRLTIAKQYDYATTHTAQTSLPHRHQLTEFLYQTKTEQRNLLG